MTLLGHSIALVQMFRGVNLQLDDSLAKIVWQTVKIIPLTSTWCSIRLIIIGICNIPETSKAVVI